MTWALDDAQLEAVLRARRLCGRVGVRGVFDGMHTSEGRRRRSSRSSYFRGHPVRGRVAPRTRDDGFTGALHRAIDRARAGRPPLSESVRFELRRKILHIVTAVAAVPVLLVVPLWLAFLLGAGGIAVVTVTWAIERRRLPAELKGPLHDEFAEVLEKTRRPGEDYPWSPVLYTVSLMVIALAHVTLGLSWSVAFAAYAILGVGDAASALVGVAYGRTKLPWNARKSVEGTCAGGVAGFLGGVVLGAAPILFAGALVPPLFLGIVLVGAVAGALAETIPRVEDNFVVPLASAAVMFGLVRLSGLALP